MSVLRGESHGLGEGAFHVVSVLLECVQEKVTMVPLKWQTQTLHFYRRISSLKNL